MVKKVKMPAKGMEVAPWFANVMAVGNLLESSLGALVVGSLESLGFMHECPTISTGLIK